MERYLGSDKKNCSGMNGWFGNLSEGGSKRMEEPKGEKDKGGRVGILA